MLKVRRIEKKEVEIPGLGARIRQAQEASGKKPIEVYRAINVSRTYWYNLVNDSEESLAEPKLREIERVLGVDFGVTFD